MVIPVPFFTQAFAAVVTQKTEDQEGGGLFTCGRAVAKTVKRRVARGRDQTLQIILPESVRRARR